MIFGKFSTASAMIHCDWRVAFSHVGREKSQPSIVRQKLGSEASFIKIVFVLDNAPKF